MAGCRFLGLLVFVAFSPLTYGLETDLREQCILELQHCMVTETEWVKVHAAEHLLALSYEEGVRECFLKELETSATTPKYRIGIWRVLARAEHGADQKAAWLAPIKAAFLDEAGPDRLHAVETLAKLGYRPPPEARPRFEAALAAEDGAMRAYAAWVLAQSGATQDRARLTAMLSEADERARSCAAYALRMTPVLPEAAAQALQAAADTLDPGAPASIHLMTAAAFHARQDTEKLDAKIARIFEPLGPASDKGEKYAALLLLADAAAPRHGDLAKPYLHDANADVRQAAAYALLRMERRTPRRLAVMDWAVLALYALGMVLVGFYYARRTRTREEYLLGGRAMRPLFVGLSMFATLLSTLSYLAWPGEMIKHGPMIACQYLCFPFILLAIGWGLIPYIMKLRVTSAYEILERRLGLSVRMLGAFFFLALRLMWMAVIIYATSSKVLIPMLGWSERATPLICLALGLLTVIYASMGGLRAVVMTDVAQAAILFFGAFLTLTLVTVRMGGVGAWWPREWAPYWDEFHFWFDPNARITILGAAISCFVWYLCTAGSDQVAIQRYLATRDAPSARRVLMVSLTADMLVGAFLAILGLSLLAWFRSHPHWLPDGQQVFTNSDILFPRFIFLGFPVGVSGLVLAGLLAAAMSSLSSGLNASSSVLSVDFLDRLLQRKAITEAARLSRARWLSVAVGLTVILLSIGVGEIQGNLLEILYRIVNLLTAPLFVLFFMAMFVPWATAFGALFAGLCATAMAIGIVYGGWFGLSFIWMMPLSLLSGIATGALASLFPLGERASQRLPWGRDGQE